MSDPSKSLLALIVDRSGSMSSRADDASGGINTLIKEQAESTVGTCAITLVQFDDHYEVVHKAMPAKDVPEYRLVARGSTALLDAVGRCIVETGEYLSALPEDERPGLVVITTVTDGFENRSSEYTKARIKEMIEHQTTKYGWQFQFLGADASAFGEAGAMGYSRGTTAQYDPDKGTKALYATTSNAMARARSASSRGLDVASALAYTSQERNAMETGEEPPAK